VIVISISHAFIVILLWFSIFWDRVRLCQFGIYFLNFILIRVATATSIVLAYELQKSVLNVEATRGDRSELRCR
jgi:hypothetical protein